MPQITDFLKNNLITVIMFIFIIGGAWVKIEFMAEELEAVKDRQRRKIEAENAYEVGHAKEVHAKEKEYQLIIKTLNDQIQHQDKELYHLKKLEELRQNGKLNY